MTTTITTIPATTPSNIIQYSSRTFGAIRTDLVNYIKSAYPAVFQDFTDSSIGSMLIDINAGIGNNLAINTDRIFVETELAFAQQKTSIMNIAKNLGFNIPAKQPSVTVVDFTITIPVLGDSPDASYYPVLAPGAQVMGGGNIFETQEVIDWNSPISNLGDSNRAIIPNYDSNGIIINYSVTKREVVINGSTSIYKRVVTSADVVPFLQITLPDSNIIEIENVILLEGTNYSTNPNLSTFYTADNVFYEVKYLAQQKVFVDNPSLTPTLSGNTNGIMAGKWLYITKKFIKEFTPNGFCVMTFGGGDADVNAFKSGFIKAGVNNRSFLDNYLNNTALGEKLLANYTLFVRYRTGGGVTSNIGSGVLTQLGTYQMVVSGALQNVNQSVSKSLSVNNPIPAIGGNDGLSINQIRLLIAYNFSSQGRDVQLTDYLVDVYDMPGKYGSPFRANVFKENNKIVIPILGIGSDGNLTNTSNSLLKQNIANYISGNRMVNDYVEIRDGRIFNLAFDIYVYVDNTSDNQIGNNIINIVNSYLDINNYEMNDDLFLGQLHNQILTANGVINVIDITVYNKVGGQYSLNAISQNIIDTTTGEIEIINNTIYSEPDTMFEILNPQNDIKVYLRRKT
jgi:hypothetical protein